MKLIIVLIAFCFSSTTMLAEEAKVDSNSTSEDFITIGALDVRNNHDDFIFSLGMMHTERISGNFNVFVSADLNLGTGGYSDLYNITMLFGFRYAPPKGIDGICSDFGTGIGVMNSKSEKNEGVPGLCGKMRMGYQFSDFAVYLVGSVYSAENTSYYGNKIELTYRF